MGFFKTNTRARAWMVTIQLANIQQQSGLSEKEYMRPGTLAKHILAAWEGSGKGRNGAVAVCKSAEGLYHAHAALYGNTTTLSHVAKVLWGSHVEPQLGGRNALLKYLKKEPPFDEKGEEVLYIAGLENIQDARGKRSDLDAIESMLAQGFTPREIFAEDLAYRRFEKLVKSAYIYRRLQEAPLIKDMLNEYHVGESGTGKSYYYIQLCKKFGENEIYLCTDFETGGLDLYLENGAPPILFLDEFKGNMPFSQLLILLDKYTRSQIHSRWVNTVCLWTRVVITSVYPPEEAYRMMVEGDRRAVDSIQQLLRRLDRIVYHYINDKGEYKSFALPADEYINYEDLRNKALESNGDSFEEIQGNIEF